MKFSEKLHQGIFLKRYKRFFADIHFNGEVITAHVPNTGSLKSVNISGQPCLFSVSHNPERKLKYTLEMIQVPSGSWVGVNTSLPNAIVKEALLERRIPEGILFDEVKSEYKINAETRLDFALIKTDSSVMHFIEVKNVTLAEEGLAQFPDAVTTRGQKHLRELMSLMEKGHTAEIIFTIQRNDCQGFSPADSIDPEYGELLRLAQKKGLKISPYVVILDENQIILSNQKLPLQL